MATIIVSGPIANKPGNGGNAWAILSWAVGVRQLGCEVYFVEQIDRANCVDAGGAVTPFQECVNLAYFRRVVAYFGFSKHSALIYEKGEQAEGLTVREVCAVASSADLLINISGHLDLHTFMRGVRRKAYLDLDPGYTQFWHAAENGGARLSGHDLHFTIGESIGTQACLIPTAGVTWRRARHPAVLQQWPLSAAESLDRFTTIASWRGAFGPIEYQGRTFGLKVHEFRKFIEMPARTGRQFEIALSIHPGDRTDLDSLHAHGWHVVDPGAVAGEPEAFRHYVQSSSAEFSVAQGIYVDTNSGWFSDRTVRYLASGKPVLVQDTGFSRNLPVGEGLVAFRTMEEAVAGAQRISRDYASHSRAARAVAEEHFDSDRVLADLLDQAGVGG